MSQISKRQASLLKRVMRNLYGRSYIPLMSSDNTLSIGDILLSKRDIPIVDGGTFKKENIEFVEGAKLNRNITSNSEVGITTKFKGNATMSNYFNVDEAGLAVEFTAENQMFLKVQGMRQQSIVDFVSLRKEILKKYIQGELSPKIYVVRGLVYADKYYLQYSGVNGGTILFNLDADSKVAEAEVNGDFTYKWRKNVGYNIDGLNGGVLAYRVSGVRLRRHQIPKHVHDNILSGMHEADALDNLAFSEREKLLNEDALEIVDLTDEVLLEQSEFSV